MIHSSRFLLAVLAAGFLSACGGGGSSGGAATFTVYGSAQAPAPAARAAIVVAAGSPTSLRQRFYAAWVSESADCSNPVLVQDHGDAGEVIDYYASPVIFASSPPDGTYECLIVRMSDTMTFQPDAAAAAAWPGACVEGQSYDFDVFRTGDTWKTKDGADVAGDGAPGAAVAQTVDLFISTDPTQVNAVPQQELQLASPLVVPGQTTMYMDFSNQVHTNSGFCWLETPVSGFE